MHNNKSKNRRKILLSLAGGLVGASQLPKSWTKPVVNAVLLPAHAQTTETDAGPVTPTPPPPPPPLPTAFSGPISFSGIMGDNKGPANKVLSLFVPEAYAGDMPTPVISGQLCITIDSPGGSTYTTMVSISSNFNTAVYEGSGTVGGGPTTPSLLSGCFANLDSVSIEVTNVSETGADYIVTADSDVTSGILPEGSDCPDASACVQPQ